MPHALPAVLENRWVRLTQLTVADTDTLVQLAADPRIWQTAEGISLATTDMYSDAGRRAYVQQALHLMAQGKAWAFVTRDAHTGAPLGSTRYGEIAHEHQRTEIGWTWLVPAAQRSSANRAAKLLLLDYAFDTWGLQRVEFKADALNARSRAALLGIGASYEGTFRQHMLLPDGRQRDTVYYSILRSEWPTIRAAHFAAFV